MYYRIAIVTPHDPIADNATWETYEQLKLAGHAVELIDAARVPGLLAEDGTITEELFARFAEVFHPDYVATHGETAEEILAACEAGEGGQPMRPRHFVVFGYVGKNNFGDELIFGVIRKRLAMRYPGCYVSLIGDGPANALARHGVASTTPDQKAFCHALLNGASALVFMAGVMFDEPMEKWTSGLIDVFNNPYSEISGQAACMLLAYMCNVPVVCLGIGAGPLENPDSQALVRLEALTNPLYLARDQRTADLLLAAGVPQDLVHLRADMAFLLSARAYSDAPAPEWLAQEGLQPNKYIAVALRNDDAMPPEFCARVASALDYYYERYGIVPVFFDFAPEDNEYHSAVVKSMKRGEIAHVFTNTQDTKATLAVLARAHAALGMRLHCSVLAALFGIPFAGFDYADKVGAFYQRMGRSAWALPLNARLGQMVAALEGLEHGRTAQIKALREAVAENRELARQAFDELCAIASAHDPRPQPQRRYSRIVSREAVRLAQIVAEGDARVEQARQEANELRAQLADVQQQLNAAQAQVEALYESNSWKAGRAVTALPRAIKRKRG